MPIPGSVEPAGSHFTWHDIPRLYSPHIITMPSSRNLPLKNASIAGQSKLDGMLSPKGYMDILTMRRPATRSKDQNLLSIVLPPRTENQKGCRQTEVGP